MAHPICPFLRAKIRQFLGRKGESLRWLSKQTGINYPKLYRLDSGESNSFSFFEARRVLRYIDPDNYRTALMEFYPGEASDLAEDKVASESDEASKIEAIDFILRSEYHYEFYLFVAESPDTDRILVGKAYGERGLTLMESFIAKGAITECEGKFVGVVKGLLDPPNELVTEMGKIHLELIDLGCSGSIGRNYAKGLNLEGRRALYSRIKEAWNDIYKIFEDKQFQGSDLTVFSLFFGSLGGRQEK